MARAPSYVTKKDLAEHKREVKKMIKESAAKIKKADIKQDKKDMVVKRKKKEHETC